MDVQMCFMSLQFSKGLRKLRNHNPRVLTGVQVHLALVLQRAQLLTLERQLLKAEEKRVRDEDERSRLNQDNFENDPYERRTHRPSEQAFDCVKSVVEYAGTVFQLNEQLRYIQVLRAKDKLVAYIQILRTHGVSETLIGRIQPDGSYNKGLLEIAMQDAEMEEGTHGMEGENSEQSNHKFREVMEHCGVKALERGQYIEAMRLLHLGRKFDAVIHVLQRCLRLPIWEKHFQTEQARYLDIEIKRFMAMYSPQNRHPTIEYNRSNWEFLWKVYQMRQFYEFCKHGRYFEALDIFDEERFLDDLDEINLADQENTAENAVARAGVPASAMVSTMDYSVMVEKYIDLLYSGVPYVAESPVLSRGVL
jgi:hypothetical protein